MGRLNLTINCFRIKLPIGNKDDKTLSYHPVKYNNSQQNITGNNQFEPEQNKLLLGFLYQIFLFFFFFLLDFSFSSFLSSYQKTYKIKNEIS